MFAILASLIFASTQAITATMFANPAFTNQTSTLFVMINLNSAATGLIITQQSQASSQALCTAIDPVSIPIASCIASGNQIIMRFSVTVVGSFYFQISQYLTPPSTIYTGFTLTTYDPNNITLEQINNIQLTSLTPRPLNATLISGSTRLGAFTTLTLSVTPKSQCSTCVIDIAGPGLSQAICTGCSLTPQGVRIGQTISFNKLINFQLSNVQNPSTFSGSAYTIQITDTSTSGLVEIAYLNVIATDPAILTTPSAVLTGSTTIGMLTSIEISFNIPILFQQACSINVTIPNDFTNLQQFTQQVQASGILQNILQFTVLPNNIVSIRNACIFNSGQAKLTLSFVRNPIIVKPTQSLRITIADTSSRVVGITTDAFTVSGFTAGSVSTLQVTLSNPIVQSKSAATLTILPQHQLYPQSFIVLTLPVQFNSTSTNITCSSLNLIATVAAPICQLSAGTVVITNMFYSTGYNPLTDGSIVLQVSTFTTTPDSVSALEFQVQTFADVNQPVDSSAFTLNILQPGVLIPAHQLINDTTSVTTQLFLSFTLTSKLALGNTIQVVLPPDIGLSLSPYCTGLPSQNCSLKVVQSNVVSISGLGNKIAGTKVNFTIGDLQLPRYAGQIMPPVIITTMTSNQQVVDNGTVTLAISRSQSLNILSVTSSSYQNSAYATVKISFQTNLISLATDKVLISFMNQTFLQPFSTNLTIQVQNPASLQPQPLQVSIVDALNRTLATSAQFVYQTTVPSVLSTQLFQSSTIASAQSNFTFTSQSALGYTMITLPTCMQPPNQIFNQNYTIVSQQQLQLVVTSNSFTLGLVNPSESCLNQQVTIQTYSDATYTYLVGNQTLQPSIACIGLCTACLPTNRSYCTQCPALLSQHQGQCVTQCPNSFYSFNQYCTQCQANCTQCNSKQCLSCGNGTVLLNGTCVQKSQCLQPNFIKNNSCQSCQLPCQSCSSTGQCLQCQSSTYLLDGACSTTCPANYELSSNVCQQQTTGLIVFGLFLSLPCTYCYVALCIILLVVKIIAKQRMSLVMTHVMLLQIIVQGSLLYTTQQNIILYLQNPSVIACVMAFLPLTSVVMLMIFNVWISVCHHRVLQGYHSHWIVYLPSVVLTFHCLSQVALGRQSQEPTDEQVKSMLRYLRQYTGVSKAYFYICIIPVCGILSYQTYLDINVQLRSQDTCIVLMMLAMWLQLALYYPPEDNIVSVYIFDSLTDLNDNEAFKTANNSIHLQVNKMVSKRMQTPAPIRDEKNQISLCEIQMKDVSETAQPKGRPVLESDSDVYPAFAGIKVTKNELDMTQDQVDLTMDQMIEWSKSERPKKKLTFFSDIK